MGLIEQSYYRTSEAHPKFRAFSCEVSWSKQNKPRALIAKVIVSSDVLAGHGQGPGHYVKVL